LKIYYWKIYYLNLEIYYYFENLIAHGIKPKRKIASEVHFEDLMHEVTSWPKCSNKSSNTTEKTKGILDEMIIKDFPNGKYM